MAMHAVPSVEVNTVLQPHTEYTQKKKPAVERDYKYLPSYHHTSVRDFDWLLILKTFKVLLSFHNFEYKWLMWDIKIVLR